MDKEPSPTKAPTKALTKAKTKTGAPTPKNSSPTRRLTAWLAGALFLMSLILPWLPGLDPTTIRWMAGTMGKVGIVLGLVWLSFPQLMWLQRLPGGSAAVSAFVFCLLMVAIRPRAVLYLGPLSAVAATVLVFLSWITRRNRAT
jgi:hypothetical protein